MHKSRIWLDWVWLQHTPSCPNTFQNAPLEATRPPPLLPPPYPIKHLLPPSHTLWSELHAHCPETWWTIQPYGNFSSQQASVSYICVCQPEWMQRQQWQQQSGSGSDLAQASGSLSLTFCFNLAERRHTSSSSAHSGRKSSLSFSSAPWADSNSFMNDWGRIPCNLRILFSSGHKVDALSGWLEGGDVMLSSAPLEQGWLQPPGVHVSSYSPSSFPSASLLPSGMRGSKSAGFLIRHHPPSDCVVILFLSTALDLKASQAKQRD